MNDFLPIANSGTYGTKARPTDGQAPIGTEVSCLVIAEAARSAAVLPLAQGAHLLIELALTGIGWTAGALSGPGPNGRPRRGRSPDPGRARRDRGAGAPGTRRARADRTPPAGGSVVAGRDRAGQGHSDGAARSACGGGVRRAATLVAAIQTKSFGMSPAGSPIPGAAHDRGCSRQAASLVSIAVVARSTSLMSRADSRRRPPRPPDGTGCSGHKCGTLANEGGRVGGHTRSCADAPARAALSSAGTTTMLPPGDQRSGA